MAQGKKIPDEIREVALILLEMGRTPAEVRHFVAAMSREEIDPSTLRRWRLKAKARWGKEPSDYLVGGETTAAPNVAEPLSQMMQVMDGTEGLTHEARLALFWLCAPVPSTAPYLRALALALAKLWRERGQPFQPFVPEGDDLESVEADAAVYGALNHLAVKYGRDRVSEIVGIWQRRHAALKARQKKAADDIDKASQEWANRRGTDAR